MKVFLKIIVFLCVFTTAYAPLTGYVKALTKNQHSTRDNLIKAYFKQGYSYPDIILFLFTINGIRIGLTQLCTILRRLGLRRRVEHNEEQMRRTLDVVRREIAGSG